MYKKSFLLFFLSLTLLFSSECKATHAVGADLTYVCLGGNTYRFYFTLYRDCQGIAVNSFYQLDGVSSCGGFVTVLVNFDTTVELSHTCSTTVTQCVNAASPIMGIEANYYHGDVTLPSPCNFWTFGLSPAICNRNAAINNLIPNGSSYCLYVKATLNNDAVQCNNSPSFSNAPVQFLCAGGIQHYIEHTFESDGDSLS